MRRNLAALLLVAPMTFAAQAAPGKSNAFPDPISDCERLAMTYAKGSAVTSVRMDRDPAKLWTNRFEHKVGGVMVSVEYLGWAEVAIESRPAERQRFVCLHSGDRGRAIYTVLIPNNL